MRCQSFAVPSMISHRAPDIGDAIGLSEGLTLDLGYIVADLAIAVVLQELAMLAAAADHGALAGRLVGGGSAIGLDVGDHHRRGVGTDARRGDVDRDHAVLVGLRMVRAIDVAAAHYCILASSLAVTRRKVRLGGWISSASRVPSRTGRPRAPGSRRRRSQMIPARARRAH